MLINRNIDDFLAKRMFGGKVLIVYGSRQAGKTTSITAFLTERGLLGKSLIFNGDEPADREILADISSERLKLLLGAKKVLCEGCYERDGEIVYLPSYMAHLI